MKKSFLQTLIVLCVFSIFLIGNFQIINAQAPLPIANDLVVRPTATSTPVTGATQNPLAAPGESNIDDGNFNNALQSIYLSLLIMLSKGVGLIMGITGWLFDETIAYTTVYPTKIAEGIYGSWKIIRDFANIVLIFSLLYLGIKTIIEGNGFADKKVLIGVIIAAVLINFSFFFVKDVAFNISNTVGLQILQQANIGLPDPTTGKVSYSAGFMEMVKPQTILNGWKESSLAENNDWARIFGFTGKLILLTFVVVCLGIIFLGVSITLLYRFLIFIALIIASPVGLISTQIPWLKNIGKDWISQLKKQTMYFPAFALVLYIVMYIVTTLVASSPPTLSLFDWNSLFLFIFNFLLIIGFMFGLLILPGRIGAAGADLLTQSGGYLKDRVRSIPQRTAGTFAGTGARAGRYVIGKGIGATLTNGDNKFSKYLQKSAQGTGAGAFFAQQTLNAGQSLKNKTYDIRNVDAVKKTKFGKAMGTGIKNWEAEVKVKKDLYEKRKKDEMKRFGFDGLAKTKEAQDEVLDLKRRRDIHQVSLKQAEKDFKNSGSETDRAALVLAQKTMEDLEQKVGEAQNIGESKYSEQLDKRLLKRLNPKQTSRAGIKEMQDDMKKRWKKDGQSTAKKKDAAALSSGTPPTPPPAPPTP